MSCTVDEKGNWHVGEMPDDALPPDSLVGRMLRPEPHYVSDEAFDALQSFIAEDAASPPPATVEPQPLWREMLKAGMHAERCDPGPLPVLGLGAAFAYSRKLRQRVQP